MSKWSLFALAVFLQLLIIFGILCFCFVFMLMSLSLLLVRLISLVLFRVRFFIGLHWNCGLRIRLVRHRCTVFQNLAVHHI